MSSGGEGDELHKDIDDEDDNQIQEDDQNGDVNQQESENIREEIHGDEEDEKAMVRQTSNIGGVQTTMQNNVVGLSDPQDQEIQELLDNDDPILDEEEKNRRKLTDSQNNDLSQMDLSQTHTPAEREKVEQENYMKKMMDQERKRYDFLMIRNMKLKVELKESSEAIDNLNRKENAAMRQQNHYEEDESEEIKMLNHEIKVGTQHIHSLDKDIRALKKKQDQYSLYK